jgi:hypothetical protein
MKVVVNPGRKVVLADTLGIKPRVNRVCVPGTVFDMPDKDAKFHIARGDVREYEPRQDSDAT